MLVSAGLLGMAMVTPRTSPAADPAMSPITNLATNPASRMPTPDEIERLEIAPGTPVAEHIRTGYTRTDQAVRVMVSIIPGDTFILEYKIPT
jgi:DNA-binding GntR family transcriptional regulator